MSQCRNGTDLQYDIKRCLAPCVESICSQTEYSEAVQRTQMFLEGRNEELLTDLNAQMRSASSAERYEGAASAHMVVVTNAAQIAESAKQLAFSNGVQLWSRPTLGDLSNPLVYLGPLQDQ